MPKRTLAPNDSDDHTLTVIAVLAVEPTITDNRSDDDLVGDACKLLDVGWTRHNGDTAKSSLRFVSVARGVSGAALAAGADESTSTLAVMRDASDRFVEVRSKLAQGKIGSTRVESIEDSAMHAAVDLARLIALARYSDEKDRKAFVRKMRKAIGFSYP